MDIDKEIVNSKAVYVIHSCRYAIFEDEKKRLWNTINIPNINDIPKLRSYNCFGSLFSQIMKNLTANRIYYKIEEHKQNLLSIEQKEGWIKLNKRHKLLPAYICPKHAAEDVYIFDFKEYSPSQLYVYLSTIRCIEEIPKFIKAVIYLVNEYKMNFYAAYVLASRICVNWKGHHIIDYIRDYGMQHKNIDKVTVPIKYIISLKRYAEDMYKYDKRKIQDNPNNLNWNCHNTIHNICKISSSHNAEDLTHPLIEEAIMSDTDEEAKVYIDEFKREMKIKKVLITKFFYQIK